MIADWFWSLFVVYRWSAAPLLLGCILNTLLWSKKWISESLDPPKRILALCCEEYVKLNPVLCCPLYSYFSWFFSNTSMVITKISQSNISINHCSEVVWGILKPTEVGTTSIRKNESLMEKDILHFSFVSTLLAKCDPSHSLQSNTTQGFDSLYLHKRNALCSCFGRRQSLESVF